MVPSVCGVPLAVVVLLILVSPGAACPRSCSCYQPTELHCTFRSLLTIPQTIPQHTVHINLGFNSISRIPERSLAGLKRLELLMLHGNDIHEIPDGVFRDLSSLQVLKMSYNKLREISAENFSGLSSLLRLHLDHNRLQFLHPRALLQLPNLRLIRLQGNRLHQLHPQAFCTLSLLQTFCYSTLRHLDVSNNSLTALPRDTLRGAPLLESLSLQTNPWTCDCSMAWLQAWRMSHPGVLKCIGTQCPVCSSPNHLKERGLLQQENLSCTLPAIATNPRALSQEDGEIQQIEAFREALGHISLEMSDQQGNSVDLKCNITHSSQTPDITPPHLASSSTPISLPLSVSLDCEVDTSRYERLWRLLAYYSETPVRLQREIMLRKTPRLAYRYRQTAEREGYYHTGVQASLQAKPAWLLQTHISLQLNRVQSSAHKVKLILSTLVSAPPDPPFPHPWVIIQTGNTRTAFTAAEGSQVHLPCPVLSSTGDLNSGDPRLQWVLPDGSTVSSPFRSSDGRVQVSAQGLVLQRVDHSDAGLYYCVARLGGDVDVLRVRLAVVESSKPPPGEELGPAVTGLVGVPVSLPCEVSGSPRVEVYWVLPSGGVVGCRNKGRRRGEAGVTVLANGTLSLPLPGLDDAGIYRCVAVNQLGATSLSTTLTLTSRLSDTSPRSKYPMRPQPAVRVSNGVSAHLRGEEAEGWGSGDDKGEGENILPSRAVVPKRGPKRQFPQTRQPPVRSHTVKVEGGASLRKGNRPLSRGSPVEQRRNRLEGRRKFNLAKHKIDPQKWADLLIKIREKTAPKISDSLYVSPATTVLTTTSAPSYTHPESEQPNRIQPDTMQPDSTLPKTTPQLTVGRKPSQRPVLESNADAVEGSSIDNPSLQEEGLNTVQTSLFPDLLTKDKVDTETPKSSGQTNNIPQTPQSNTNTGTEIGSFPRTTKPSSSINDIITEQRRQSVTAVGEKEGTEMANHRQVMFPNSVPSRPRTPWNARRRPGQRRRINRPRVRPTPLQGTPGPTSRLNTLGLTATSSAVTEPGELPAPAITTFITTSITSSTAAPSSTRITAPSRVSVSPRAPQTHTDRMTHSANTAAWLPDSNTHSARHTHTVTHSHTGGQGCAEREGQVLATNNEKDSSVFNQRNPDNVKSSPPRTRTVPGETTPTGTDEEPCEIEPNEVHPLATDEEHREVRPPALEEEPNKMEPVYPDTDDESNEVEPVYPAPDEEPIEVEPLYPAPDEEPIEVEPLYPAPDEEPIEVEPLYPAPDEEPIEVEPLYPAPDEEPIEVEPLYPAPDEEPIEVEPLYPAPDEEPIEIEAVFPVTEEAPSEIELVHVMPDEPGERQQGLKIDSSLLSTKQLLPPTTSDPVPSTAVIVSVRTSPTTISTTAATNPIPTTTSPTTTTTNPTTTSPTTTTTIPTTTSPTTITTIPTTTTPTTTTTNPTTTTTITTTTSTTAPLPTATPIQTTQTTIPTTTTKPTATVWRDPGLNVIPGSHSRYHSPSFPTYPQRPSSRHPYVYHRSDPVRTPLQTPPTIKHAPSLPNSAIPKRLHPGISETPTPAISTPGDSPGTPKIPTPSKIRLNPASTSPHPPPPSVGRSVNMQHPPLTPTLRVRPRIAPPHVRPMSVPAESDALLPCKAIGQPPPAITWTKVSTGAVMSLDSKAERFQVLPNGTLFIRSVQVQDRGTYICSAQSPVGLDRAMVTLEVWSRPPSIQPPSHREATVHQGGEVRLECRAQGVPVPLLSWVLPDQSVLTPHPHPNRTHVPNPRVSIFPNGTLRIVAAGPADRGLYRCMASNPAGAGSLSVRLHVSSLRPAIQQPREERVTRPAGMPVYAHCSALGAPAPSIRWRTPDGTLLLPSQFLNGNLFVLPNATLLIRKLSVKDSGSYECLATNAVGGDKRTVRVEVNGGGGGGVVVSTDKMTSSSDSGNSDRFPSSAVLKPPLLPASFFSKAQILSTSPSSSLVMYGDSLLLHCSTTGNPEPRVVWRVPGKKLVDAQYSFDKRMKVHSNGTLEIQSVTEEDGGDYLCVARNKMADDYRLLRVTVITKPARIELKQPLRQRGVSYGAALRVDCLASGRPRPAVRWSLPDGTSVRSVSLQGDEGEGRGRRLVVFDNGTLFLPSVGMGEEGEYVCHAENPWGKDTMRVAVKVLASPPIFSMAKYEAIKVRYGATVSLNCGAKGEPAPTVTWLSPNNRVLPVGRSGPVVVRPDGSLVIQAATGAEGGNYTCRARNSVGERSRVIGVELMVNQPTFSVRGAGLNGADRQTAVLSGIGAVISNSQSAGRDPRVSAGNGVSDNGVSHVGDQSVSAVRGQTVFLPCPSQGFPPPRLYWLLPGNGVLPAPYYGSRLTVHRNGTLELRGLRAGDGGMLVCVARSEGGEIRMKVHLEVSDKQERGPVPPKETHPVGLVSTEESLPKNPVTEEMPGPKRLSITIKSRQETPQSRHHVTSEQPHSGSPVTIEKPIPKSPVTIKKPLPGSPVTIEKPLPRSPVTIEKPLPGSPVTIEKPIPKSPVTIKKPLPGSPVTIEKPLPRSPVTIEKPLPRSPVTIEKPLPRSPVTIEKPLPGSPVTIEKPLPKSPVTIKKPLPGSPVTTEKPHSGGSVTVEKPLSGIPARGDTSQTSGSVPETGRGVVLEKPVVISRSASLVSIINGENLQIPCPAQGSRQLQSLTWTLPSGVVMSRGQTAGTGRYSVLDDGTLIIQQVSVFDRGTYSCRSTSEDNLSILTVPVIVIAYPPRITNGPPPLTYTRPGVAVQLTCFAIATPRATITWEMPDQSQLRVTGQARLYGNRYLSPQGSLVIQNPTSRDTGFYRCTAQNVIGTDTKATYLHVI
ncbi:matrix-remodeling-associated protein 5 [Esox lucius]|uniref:matrix-remodeling-associated protein 5 n=1 Tax=Esox lucius TaxID=8010 RepID=UPI001476B2EE|nr:matrix-remodeling-associated protein 5 [Esox lucius]XP_028969476.2 matrix-remodeling-associated protein 5 [Esox lucius]